MNWININLNRYVPIESTDNTGTSIHLMFSPVPIPVGTNENEYNNEDTRVVFVKVNKYPTLEEARLILKNLIIEYDKSDEVNLFKYNNYTYWFDKETRLALKYKFEVLKESNETIGTIWFGSKMYNVDIDNILAFLKELELYAMNCNDITHQHINEIKELDNLEDILMYDITKDYPEHISMNNTVFKAEDEEEIIEEENN